MLAQTYMVMAELNPFEYLPQDSWGRIIGIILIVLIGWQGRGFIIAYREDKRKEAADDIDLLEEVKKITRDEMQNLRDELAAERTERRRLATRVMQLERMLHANGLDVPPDGV